jgi:hypothetical protein
LSWTKEIITVSTIGSRLVADLAAALATVRRDGDFFASGAVETPAPRLEVDGFGVIALPLLPAQAGQLIAVAERAPCGRGADTTLMFDAAGRSAPTGCGSRGRWGRCWRAPPRASGSIS